MFQTKVVEKMRTRILYSIIPLENRDVYEVMRKKYGTARQATDDSIRCRKKGSDTLLWYTSIILIASSLQNCLREGAAMFRYTYIACLVSLWAQDPGLSTRENTRVVTTEISGTASIINVLFLAFLPKRFFFTKSSDEWTLSVLTVCAQIEVTGRGVCIVLRHSPVAAGT